MNDRKDETNTFYWDSVVQNCPGTNEYDPSMPGLYWWDSTRQVITVACKTVVDDLWSVAATKQLSRDATHHIENGMS